MALIMIPIDLLLCALGVVAFLWLRRGKKLPGNEARCAKCMYIANGLPTPICPECGSDLAVPGAVIVGGRLPATRLARSIGWSLCMPTVAMVGAIAWAILSQTVLPRVSDQTSTITLYSPASKAYKNIAIEAQLQGLVSPRENGTLFPKQLAVKIVRNDNTPRSLIVDLPNLHYRDAAVAGGAFGTAPLDEVALASWLRDSGVQGDSKLITSEMNMVMDHVRMLSHPSPSHPSRGTSFSMNSVFGGAGTGSTGTVHPVEWLVILPIGLVLLFWGIGMWRILIG